jgi:hypothetical protein
MKSRSKSDYHKIEVNDSLRRKCGRVLSALQDLPDGVEKEIFVLPSKAWTYSLVGMRNAFCPTSIHIRVGKYDNSVRADVFYKDVANSVSEAKRRRREDRAKTVTKSVKRWNIGEAERIFREIKSGDGCKFNVYVKPDSLGTISIVALDDGYAMIGTYSSDADFDSFMEDISSACDDIRREREARNG